MASYPVISRAVYNGRDNPIEIFAHRRGAVIADLSAITRVTITIGSTTIDSAVVGSSVIWWTDSILRNGVSTNYISMVLGHQSLAVGEYTDCKVVIYDAQLTNGVQLESPLKLTVYD